MKEPITIHGFSEKQLMEMEPVNLRAILHERTHHTIEVFIYRILNGSRSVPEDFGRVAETLMEIWKNRELPLDPPDI